MLEQFFVWYNGLTDGLWGALLLFAVGVVLLIKGGDWFVDSAVGIAKRFRVPEIIIGATVVSIGTTLPEVMVSVTAAVNNNGALSLGNIIGANIFNLVLVSGAAVTISPFAIPEGSKLLGYNTSQLFEIPVMVAVMALMTLPAPFKKKLSRWQGITLLGIYTAFVTLQVLIAIGVV